MGDDMGDDMGDNMDDKVSDDMEVHPNQVMPKCNAGLPIHAPAATTRKYVQRYALSTYLSRLSCPC